MELSFDFFFKSILLGIGLAMDAFSVSMANGLNEPCMTRRRQCGIAAMFAFFQALMPMIGWVCVHTVLQHFKVFEGFVPYIALALLGFIGIKMIIDSLRAEEACKADRGLGFTALVIQGIATSIDALSVGITVGEYAFLTALASSGIIAAVTFIICMGGLYIGRRAGTRLSRRAGVLGGSILIFIGLEIFISGLMR